MGYTSLPSAEAAAATALADDDDDDDGGGGARGEAIVRGSRRGRTCLVQRQINHRVAFGALLPRSIVVAMHVRARRQYDDGAAHQICIIPYRIYYVMRRRNSLYVVSIGLSQIELYIGADTVMTLSSCLCVCVCVCLWVGVGVVSTIKGKSLIGMT